MRNDIRWVWTVIGSLAVAWVPSAGAVTPRQLQGLWGNETQVSQPVRGRLVVDLRTAPGEASVAGLRAPVEQAQAAIRIALPGGQGSFRGRLTPDRERIEGFWIQLQGGALGAAYATPLTLQRTQTGVWAGTVQPLIDRMSQYIQIESDSDGHLSAFLRNPEMNLARERPLTVAIDGDAVTFGDPRRSRWALHARFDEETGQLQVNWEGIGVFGFTRRDPLHAVGFYPRTPTSDAFSLQAPLDQSDGWATATPVAEGFDDAQLQALLRRVQQTQAAGAPQVQALLIAHRGRLVVEQYFQGFDADRTHDTRSAGKTFAPLLVGLAMRKGDFTPDTTLRTLLPSYRDAFGNDPRKARITVADLMTMTSGLACDDGDDASPGNEDTMQSQHGQPDWYRYTLALPMAREPGGDHAVYCSAGINLLGAVVSRSTGTWLPEFFRREVGDPLQMRGYHINLMPDGDAYLAGGIHLRPRDLIKLGQLYLDGGRWHGRQVIDRAWVEASTTHHSAFAPDHGYGYGWHLHEMTVGGHAYREYAAEGNGGQFVIVVPELDLVVGILAGNYGDFATWYKLQELVPQFVIPALRTGH